MPSQMTLTHFEFSRAQENRKTPEPGGVAPKPEAADGKTAEGKAVTNTEKEKREFQLTIQGLIFGSDQEMIVALSEFAKNLNRSSFIKEAKVQTTLKSTEYSREVAEFKILARFREEVGQSLRGSY